MAPPTRRAVPRKRPAPRPALGAQAYSETQADTEAVSDDQAAALDAGIAGLLSDFEAVLRDDPSLDMETRELLGQQLKQALDGARDADATAELPQRADWLQAVQALQDAGELEGPDAETLIRRLDEALQPLERRESKLAIEFSQRVASDGEEKALEWLRQQTEAAQTTETRTSKESPGRRPGTALRNEVVNSRSRRLRGPPKG
jgi:hypothetical protein